MPPLFFPSEGGIKAAHTGLGRFQLGGGLRPENPLDRKFFLLELLQLPQFTRSLI